MLGPVDAVAEHPDAKLVLTVGSAASPALPPRLAARWAWATTATRRSCTPAAVIAASTVVGPGTGDPGRRRHHRDVEIGAHVVLMPQVLLTHDDRVGDHATQGRG